MDFRREICSVAPKTEGPTDTCRHRIAEHGFHLHNRPSGDSFAHRLSFERFLVTGEIFLALHISIRNSYLF
jgi:hypothetical protein